jgi:hypothetical protein
MRGVVAKVALVVLFALAAGAGSAWWAVQRGARLGAVDNGPWTTNALTGSPAAGAYLRAAVAVAGLLALGQSEAIYYTAFSDSSGKPLRADCVYAVEGVDPPARWWSITAYGGDHFLVPNPQKRYAVAKTDVRRAADGSFVIAVGGPPVDGNWLATGDPAAASPFSLTLRLYNPSTAVAKHLGDVSLPRIRRTRCP